MFDFSLPSFNICHISFKYEKFYLSSDEIYFSNFLVCIDLSNNFYKNTIKESYQFYAMLVFTNNCSSAHVTFT